MGDSLFVQSSFLRRMMRPPNHTHTHTTHDIIPSLPAVRLPQGPPLDDLSPNRSVSSRSQRGATVHTAKPPNSCHAIVSRFRGGIPSAVAVLHGVSRRLFRTLISLMMAAEKSGLERGQRVLRDFSVSSRYSTSRERTHKLIYTISSSLVEFSIVSQ